MPAQTGRLTISGFNPRAPRGARLCPGCKDVRDYVFQSTRPARGATLAVLHRHVVGVVSIHAPRAGRDLQAFGVVSVHMRFNPRAPRGARQSPATVVFQAAEFQSTRPARGATAGTERFQPVRFVSIHAPRAGRDNVGPVQILLVEGFNPRAPRGARRLVQQAAARRRGVSIHAPRAGRDKRSPFRVGRRRRFNPRAPRGARLPIRRCSAALRRFQSTRPARGATVGNLPLPLHIVVSIHAPRAGRDTRSLSTGSLDSVSIHAPRAGRDTEIADTLPHG